MINRSNNDSLNSLLLVQESLRQVASGAVSLHSALPDLLTTMLKQVGSQDGRIDLVNQQQDGVLTVAVIDGRVETDAADSSTNSLLEHYILRQDSKIYIEDTLRQPNWFAASHPDSTHRSWSTLVIPIPAEQSVIGCLSILKPGQASFVPQEITFSSLFSGLLGAALTALRLKEDVRSAENRSQEILEDTSDLAATLVHDLQGPLGNVITSLEMVEAGLSRQEDSNLDLMMDIAVRSSKHLQSLVNSLLDISRLEAGQEIIDRAPVAVSELLDYASEVEGPVLEQRQVTLAGDLSPDLPPVNANADILQRVLLNLIDNALKVSRSEQAITIRAALDNDDRFVKVCVIDQGPGIPEAHRERIFEKYQRLNDMSSSKGLGLGLAFCRLAVEAHGGRIWVEGSPDEGACFCFTLPVAESSDPAS